TQANTLLHFKALSKDYANLHYAHESYKEIKLRYKECKKEMAKLRTEYDNNELEAEKKELKDLNGKQDDRIRQVEAELNESVKESHLLRKEMENFSLKCGDGEANNLPPICGHTELLTMFLSCTNTTQIKPSKALPKLKMSSESLLVLKLVLQLGSSVSLLVQEPL
ncbi:hypothetical protein Tco_1475492, partial [Tanacetum coccineum]